MFETSLLEKYARAILKHNSMPLLQLFYMNVYLEFSKMSVYEDGSQ